MKQRISKLANSSKFFQKILVSRRVVDVVFLLIFTLIILDLGLFSTNFHYPQGLHIWRQSDGFAQIMNYYYNNLNIFDWGFTFNKMLHEGRGVGEAPIHYIIQAVFFKIIGPDYWIPQVYSAVLTMTGLFCFYRATHLLIKNAWFSLTITLLFIFSPLFIAYGFRIMPDTYALALTNISYYFLVLYFKRKKQKYLWWAVFFITFTGVTKLYYLIPYIALLATFIGDFVLFKKQLIQKKQFFILCLPLLLTAIWVGIVFMYNYYHDFHGILQSFSVYNSEYPEKNRVIFQRISEDWKDQFLNGWIFYMYYITAFLTLIVALINKHWNSIIFLLLGGLGVFIFDYLFFYMLKDHDYYFLTHLFIMIVVWVFFFFEVRQLRFSRYIRFGSFLVMITVMSMQYYTIKNMMEWRYDTWRNEAMLFKNVIDNKKQIQQWVGDNLLLAYDDYTPNFTLSLLKTKGWSGYQVGHYIFTIDEIHEKGVNYILCTKTPFDSIQKKTTYPLKEVRSINGVSLYMILDKGDSVK